LYRELQYNSKIIPIEMGNSDLGKIAGTGYAAAAEVVHLALKDNGPNILLDPKLLAQARDTASAAVQAECVKAVALGRSGPPDMVAKVSDKVDKVVRKYVAECPVKGWKIIGVELKYPEHGNCRLDIIGEDEQGVLAVADNKFRSNLAADYIDRALLEFRDSWQFFHYRWAASETMGRKVYRYYPLLGIAEPGTRVRTMMFEGNDETDRMWLASAMQWWSDMEQEDLGLRLPGMNTVHQTQYGPCEMRKACFEYHLDPGLMQHDYIQIGKPINPVTFEVRENL